MPSDNVGPKRAATDDAEVPAELAQGEAQDCASSSSNSSSGTEGRSGGASGPRSPVDSMHVDAPKHQDNERGHRQDRNR